MLHLLERYHQNSQAVSGMNRLYSDHETFPYQVVTLDEEKNGYVARDQLLYML